MATEYLQAKIAYFAAVVCEVGLDDGCQQRDHVIGVLTHLCIEVALGNIHVERYPTEQRARRLVIGPTR